MRIQHLKSDSEVQGDIAESLPGLIRKHGPCPGEDINCGGIDFLNDGKVVGGVCRYKDCPSVELSSGARSEEPEALPEGKGKN